MPLKINELVIQVKVCGNDKPVEQDMPVDLLWSTTEQQKLAVAKEVLNLLEDRETR